MNPNWKKDYLRYKSYFLNVMNQVRQKSDVQIYLELFLSLFTISIFAFFAIRPTLLTISSLIKEIEAKKEIVEKMDLKIEKLIEAQSNYDQYRNQILTLNNQALPSSSKPDDFVRQVEGVSLLANANVTNVTLQDAVVLGTTSSLAKRAGLNRQEKKLPENAQAMRFTTQVASDYPTLFTFVNAITTLRRPVRIESVNFHQVRVKEDEQLVLDVQGDALYYQKEAPDEKSK